MTSQALKTYRKSLDQLYAIRIYSGTAGARTASDYPVHGKEIPGGTSTTLIGQITEIVKNAVLLAEDISIPLNTNHKLVINEKEYAILVFTPRVKGDETLGFDVAIKG